MDFFQKDFHSILKPVLQQYNQVLHFILNKDYDNPEIKVNKVLKWLFSSLGPQSGFHSVYLQNVDLESIKTCYLDLLKALELPVESVSLYYINKVSKNS
jgi:hypothetical protein